MRLRPRKGVAVVVKGDNLTLALRARSEQDVDEVVRGEKAVRARRRAFGKAREPVAELALPARPASNPRHPKRSQTRPPQLLGDPLDDRLVAIVTRQEDTKLRAADIAASVARRLPQVVTSDHGAQTVQTTSCRSRLMLRRCRTPRCDSPHRPHSDVDAYGTLREGSDKADAVGLGAMGRGSRAGPTLDNGDCDNPGWSPAALRARGPSTWSRWMGAGAGRRGDRGGAGRAAGARCTGPTTRPPVCGRPTLLPCAELSRGGRSCPP